MNSFLNYKNKRLGTCIMNFVEGFSTRPENNQKEILKERMIDSILDKHFIDTPFKDIDYYLHYTNGEENHKSITIGRINKKYKDIKLTASVYYKIIQASDKLNSEVFVDFHEVLLLDGIITTCKKHKIPEENYRELIERRSKLGNIPDWIPEMETNPQLVVDLYKASVPKVT